MKHYFSLTSSSWTNLWTEWWFWLGCCCSWFRFSLSRRTFRQTYEIRYQKTFKLYWGEMLPLHIETRMYVEENSQICPMCDLKEIENKYHFVLQYPFYWKTCEELFSNTKSRVSLINIDDCNDWTGCLQKRHFKFANYWESMWHEEGSAAPMGVLMYVFMIFIFPLHSCTVVTLMRDQQGWRLFVCIWNVYDGLTCFCCISVI